MVLFLLELLGSLLRVCFDNFEDPECVTCRLKVNVVTYSAFTRANPSFKAVNHSGNFVKTWHGATISLLFTRPMLTFPFFTKCCLIKAKFDYFSPKQSCLQILSRKSLKLVGNKCFRPEKFVALP